MNYRALIRPDTVLFVVACAWVFTEASRTLAASRWRAASLGGLALGFLLGLAVDADAAVWAALIVYVTGCALVLEAARRAALRWLVWLGWVVPGPASPALLAPVWGGLLPLWRTSWQAVVTVAALGMAGASIQRAPLHRHTRLVAAAFPLTWLLVGLAATWLVVGAWRSSRAHVRAGGRQVWAWFARLMVLLVAGAVLLEFVSAEATRVMAYGGLALSRAQRDRYSLRLLRSGTEVELSGELGFGVGKDLAALLEESPRIRVLHLDSTGGWVFEGQKVASLVRARKLNTYVANRCESACVRVFASGAERWISGRAAFGLHAAGGPLARSWSRRGGDSEERDYLVGRGVERAFVDRGLRTPFEDMWRPTRGEVLAAHLATRYARPDEVALSGLPAEKLVRLDLHLRESPFYQALFEFERPLFDRAVDSLRAGYQQGMSETEAAGFLVDEVASLVERDLPRTSDSAAAGLVRSIESIGSQLQKTDPRACAALLDGKAEAQAARVHLGPILDAMARVMIDAHNAPQAVPRASQVRDDLATIIAHAEASVPGAGDFADDEAAPARDPERYCAGALAVLQGVLHLRPEAAGRAYRYLAAQEAAGRPKESRGR